MINPIGFFFLLRSILYPHFKQNLSPIAIGIPHLGHFSYTERYSLLVDGDFSFYTFDIEEQTSSSDFRSKYSAAKKEIDNIDKEQWEDLDINDENTQGGSTL